MSSIHDYKANAKCPSGFEGRFSNLAGFKYPYFDLGEKNCRKQLIFIQPLAAIHINFYHFAISESFPLN